MSQDERIIEKVKWWMADARIGGHLEEKFGQCLVNAFGELLEEEREACARVVTGLLGHEGRFVAAAIRERGKGCERT
jgi:hypothetical protein